MQNSELAWGKQLCRKGSSSLLGSQRRDVAGSRCPGWVRGGQVQPTGVDARAQREFTHAPRRFGPVPWLSWTIPGLKAGTDKWQPPVGLTWPTWTVQHASPWTRCWANYSLFFSPLTVKGDLYWHSCMWPQASSVISHSLQAGLFPTIPHLFWG